MTEHLPILVSDCKYCGERNYVLMIEVTNEGWPTYGTLQEAMREMESRQQEAWRRDVGGRGLL